ncbi:hypothetical protein C7S16_5331 [Burkholderia thailandensis]|uniref:Uncharacterized protein n=1 Tax=Burkholderia thailandensis TaxID=57975 RepID=A0AAW9CMC2_BURTH|nr:hypothetical protein [Burkholderia thailandensis]
MRERALARRSGGFECTQFGVAPLGAADAARARARAQVRCGARVPIR